MSATSTTTRVGTPGPTRAVPTLPARGLRQDLRTVSVVWRRELLQFKAAPARALSSFIQPLLFLFVLGGGLGSVVRPGAGDAKFSTFLFPGVLATSVMFSAVFAGISMIWDRQLGFLREMLVAPVRRGAILMGKCLGGATIASAQSVVLLAIAGMVGVPYNLPLFAALVGLLFVCSFSITACGVLLGVRIKQMQAAMPITQLIITPMMFLSGSLFPLSGLPGWLHVATRLNPLTYAVDPMRTVVFAHLNVSPVTKAVFDPGITWGGWRVPALLDVGIVLGIGFALLGIATALFNREG